MIVEINALFSLNEPNVYAKLYDTFQLRIFNASMLYSKYHNNVLFIVPRIGNDSFLIGQILCFRESTKHENK